MHVCGFWTKSYFRPLTAGSVAVVSEVRLIEAAPDARFVPHLADLRHAELGVGSEEKLSVFYGEVVLLPVPKILQLVVVERREGIHAERERDETT